MPADSTPPNPIGDGITDDTAAIQGFLDAVPAPDDDELDGCAERFWSKVQRATGCWEWTAGTRRDKVGYGRFFVGGSRSDGTRRWSDAHRIAWRLTYGPIPDGLCVLHHCDNPLCCRPDHLFLGTKSDNNRDRARKLRNRATRLTLNQIGEVVRRAVSGESRGAIADDFGIHPSYVSWLKKHKGALV